MEYMLFTVSNYTEITQVEESRGMDDIEVM
jgi:hypothetical protein